MNNKMEELGFKKVPGELVSKLEMNPYKMIGKDWFLVTAGDESGWNTMTASWGFAGVMWGKNTFTTVVRPQRYTKEFIDKSEYFTISFFSEEQRSVLKFCGSHSGREFDKAKETGLTPVFFDGVTSFEQASMVLVCKKAYVQPMTGECMIDKEDDAKWFADKDYHVQYIGTIKDVYVK